MYRITSYHILLLDVHITGLTLDSISDNRSSTEVQLIRHCYYFVHIIAIHINRIPLVTISLII